MNDLLLDFIEKARKFIQINDEYPRAKRQPHRQEELKTMVRITLKDAEKAAVTLREKLHDIEESFASKFALDLLKKWDTMIDYREGYLRSSPKDRLHKVVPLKLRISDVRKLLVAYNELRKSNHL